MSESSKTNDQTVVNRPFCSKSPAISCDYVHLRAPLEQKKSWERSCAEQSTLQFFSKNPQATLKPIRGSRTFVHQERRRTVVDVVMGSNMTQKTTTGFLFSSKQSTLVYFKTVNVSAGENLWKINAGSVLCTCLTVSLLSAQPVMTGKLKY